LDLWLKQTALQHQAKGISRTFVAVPADESAVAGFMAAGLDEITVTLYHLHYFPSALP
jgi:hypothetical protein